MTIKDVMLKVAPILQTDKRVQRVWLLGQYNSIEDKVINCVKLIIDSKGHIRGLDLMEVEEVLENAIGKETQIFEVQEVSKDAKLYAEVQKGRVQIYEYNQK